MLQAHKNLLVFFPTVKETLRFQQQTPYCFWDSLEVCTKHAIKGGLCVLHDAEGQNAELNCHAPPDVRPVSTGA